MWYHAGFAVMVGRVLFLEPPLEAQDGFCSMLCYCRASPFQLRGFSGAVKQWRVRVPDGMMGRCWDVL